MGREYVTDYNGRDRRKRTLKYEDQIEEMTQEIVDAQKEYMRYWTKIMCRTTKLLKNSKIQTRLVNHQHMHDQLVSARYELSHEFSDAVDKYTRRGNMKT